MIVGLPTTRMIRGGGPSKKAYDVFLSTASGVPAMEAEVIAHALIDQHIDSQEALRCIAGVYKDGSPFTLVDETILGEIPGIPPGAATAIISASNAAYSRQFRT